MVYNIYRNIQIRLRARILEEIMLRIEENKRELEIYLEDGTRVGLIKKRGWLKGQLTITPGSGLIPLNGEELRQITAKCDEIAKS